MIAELVGLDKRDVKASAAEITLKIKELERRCVALAAIRDEMLEYCDGAPAAAAPTPVAAKRKPRRRPTSPPEKVSAPPKGAPGAPRAQTEKAADPAPAPPPKTVTPAAPKAKRVRAPKPVDETIPPADETKDACDEPKAASPETKRAESETLASERAADPPPLPPARPKSSAAVGVGHNVQQDPGGEYFCANCQRRALLRSTYFRLPCEPED